MKKAKLAPPQKHRPQKAWRIGRANSPKRPATFVLFIQNECCLGFWLRQKPHLIPITKGLALLQEEMEKTDICRTAGGGGVCEAAGTAGSNSFWFAHPVYFVKHLNDAGLLDRSVNPYKNYPFFFEGIPTAPATRVYQPKTTYDLIAEDSPGFAPQTDGNTQPDFPAFINDTKYYFTDCSSPYGVERWGSGERHTGADLRAGSREILALVYGEVWVSSAVEVPYYGNVMFIKGRGADDDKLYFLAHLVAEDRLPARTPVEPGDMVATAGNTTGGKGTSTGVHLHVEVFKDDKLRNIGYDRIDKVLHTEKINASEDRSAWWAMANFTGYRVNPFNHDKHVI